jgi:hypothetical protein
MHTCGRCKCFFHITLVACRVQKLDPKQLPAGLDAAAAAAAGFKADAAAAAAATEPAVSFGEPAGEGLVLVGFVIQLLQWTAAQWL